MGGGSKKQKVGNKYFLGLHLVICRQMDVLREIRMSEKRAFRGSQGAGRLRINKQNLFGGDEREGGFSGNIDILKGGNDQGVNSYLSSIFSPLTPAFRGVVSFVFRQPYIGANTARLPSFKVKVGNHAGIHRGWFPEKAGMNPSISIKDSAIMILMDFSGSMTANRRAAQAAAVANLVRSMKGNRNDVRIVTFGSDVGSTMERFDASDQDYEDLAVFAETYNPITLFGTNWENAVASAPAFFATAQPIGATFSSPILASIVASLNRRETTTPRSRRAMILVSDGEPSAGNTQNAVDILRAIDGLQVYLVNLDNADTTEAERLDNTEEDGGVPVLASTDPQQVVDAVIRPFYTWEDINPAHVIRCLLTDPMRNGTVPEDEIGDSFEAAADTFIAEGLGLSVKFRGGKRSDEDRREVERHCDCVTFRSRITGKWEIKLIRDDYNIANLETLDSSVITDWSGLTRPRRSELPNQLQVNYTRRRDGEPGSVTRTNTVGVREVGRVVRAADADYPFVTTQALAARFCLRDLATVTTAVLSGTVPVTYVPPGIEPGTPVIINEPRLRINNVVMRVTEIREGETGDSRAWLTLTQDKFATPPVVAMVDDVEFEDDEALNIENRLVTELSYFQAVINTGQSQVDDELEREPDLGRLIATGSKPNDRHIDATLATGSGAEWVDQGLVDFEPYGVLLNDLPQDPTVTTFEISQNTTLEEINAGDLARIGDELIRIDDLTVIDDDTLLVTVGRGCLDTVPTFHAAGSAFIVSSVVEPLATEFVAGQSVDVKMLSRTGADVLTLDEADTETVVFASRAYRPYPPGQFQVNASYQIDAYNADYSLSWVHRDRTIQTTPAVDDHLAGSIGPEPGTTYIVRVNALDIDRNLISNVVDQNVGTATAFDYDDAGTVLPAGTIYLDFRVFSLRDGYESLQSVSIIAPAKEGGYGLGYGLSYGGSGS